jgi:hypothetical protein
VETLVDIILFLVYYNGISTKYTTRGCSQILLRLLTYGQVYPHLVHKPLDVVELPSTQDRSDYFVGEGYKVHISPGQVFT